MTQTKNAATVGSEPRLKKTSDCSHFAEKLVKSQEKIPDADLFKKLNERFTLIPLNGKVPIEKDWQKWSLEKRPFNETDFKGRNAGICGGPASGVIFIDEDDVSAFKILCEANGYDIPETLTVESGAGEHLYYEYPSDGREYGNKSLKHPIFKKHTIFDIKAIGGQCVAPGSIHPETGKRYRIIKDRPVAPLPQWIADYIQGGPLSTDCLKSIPPNKVTEKIVRSMPIPDSTKEMIQKTAVTGDRSEDSFNVLKDLIKAQIHENIIFYIYDFYPIGEKYRQKGSSKNKWLSDEISRAKEKIKSDPIGSWTPEPWGEPVPFDDLKPISLKPGVLPGILNRFTTAVSAATETPLELAAGLSLSVVATAVQGKMVVQVKPGYSEPLVVWVVVALDSANRKSTVLIKMTIPLTEWEQLKRKELEPIIRENESIRKNQEARLKALRINYGKAKKEDLREVEAEILEIEKNIIAQIFTPQVWAQDVTPEHLGTLMSRNQGKMSILSTEGGIFDIIGGRYSNGVPNLDLFLQSHSGDPVRVDRGSRESVYIDNPCLSLGLSPQPDVLRGLSDKPGFRGRGLLARNLYFLPTSNLGYRTLKTSPVTAAVENEYQKLIYSLLNIEPQTDDQGKVIPYILRLSPEAFQEWFDFSIVVESDLRDGGRFEHLRDWAGKLPGAAVRIAGLLHCVDNPSQPWTTPISLETIQRALEIASVFSSHAIATFDLMGADKALDGSRKVWRWIEKNRAASFSKRECFRSLQGTFPRATDLNEPLKILAERSFVRAGKKESTGVGRPSDIYKVNPVILKGWS